MKNQLLIKFLNNQCTDEELKCAIEWIKNDSLNEEGWNFGRQDWDSIRLDEDMNGEKGLKSLLDKIHHKINIQNNFKSKTSQFASWFTRAAAILLLPVVGALLYVLSENPDVNYYQAGNDTVDSLEIVAPVGSKAVVQLSDGSKVYLNHGSKLKYPHKFDGKTRQVLLTGEGYFEVAEDKQKPFVVKTGSLYITALGTEFNVMAYPGENIIETTLVEGKVLLERSTKDIDHKKLGSMVPGQHVQFNIQSEKIYSTEVDVDKYVAWKDGKLIFKNESIVQIINRLGRWYNVDFEFRDQASKQFPYTATFVDETLFQILDLLKIATPIDYKTLPRTKLPDGTFSKQKIIIETRKLSN